MSPSMAVRGKKWRGDVRIIHEAISAAGSQVIVVCSHVGQFHRVVQPVKRTSYAL